MKIATPLLSALFLLQEAKKYVFLQMLAAKPDEVMNELIGDDSYSYADSLIVVGARRVPEDVFTCAQAPNSNWAVS